MNRRTVAGLIALAVVAVWLGLGFVLALSGCGSTSRTPVAEPPSPPVTPPPVQPPPPHVVVSDVTITVTLAGHPVSNARVILAPGVDAPTDAHGIARFRYLDAGAYEVAVRAAPPLAVQVLEPVIYVTPEARAFAVELVADIGDGQLVLLGDSDSSEPVEWRTSSVDDYLAQNVGDLVGLPTFRHTNAAQPCTSAAPTGCEHRAIEQVRDLPGDAAMVVMRWGLNDLHYEVGPDTFRSHYADALDEVIHRGAVPVVVAIQAEQDSRYRGRRDAYNRELAALAAERGAVYVDPGIVWSVDRELFAADGTHLNDAGTRRVADAVLAALWRAATVGTLVVETPPPERPCNAAIGERYALMVSDYGLIAADPAVAADDLAWLADLGVCGARIWADWRWDGNTSGSAYRDDGSPRDEQIARLGAALDFGASLGMQFDLTFGGGDFYDSLDAHTRAVRDLAGRYCGHPGVAFADLWNEADSALTRDSARRLVSAAKDACPSLNVTISLSAGASGDPDEVIDGYAEIRDLVDFAAPHWPRKDGWWERSVPYSLELQDATGLRVGLQEEARQSYQGQSWPLGAYVSVEREACEAGLLLYTQHTEAGFRPWDGPLREQLDPVTRAALEAQGAAGCGS